jgi:YHS domain-containing protein
MLRQRSAFTFVHILVLIAIIGVIVGVGAAYWFGSKHETNKPAPSQTAATTNPPSDSSGSLSAEDRKLAEKQKICPVSGHDLNSMDGPYREDVEGKAVFVCCKACSKSLHKEPAKYLEKLK